MDFGDGLAPMELPSLKNRRAALAKRAGFGAVRKDVNVKGCMSRDFNHATSYNVFGR